MPELDRPKLDEQAGKSLVTIEREIVNAESAFLLDRASHQYVGVLTSDPHSVLTIIYPALLAGYDTVYRHMSRLEHVSAEQAVIDKILYHQISNARLLTNEEIAELRLRLTEGDYSDHFHLYANYWKGPQTSDRDRVEFARKQGLAIVDKGDEDSLLRNQRACLGAMLRVRKELETRYGEIDYASALITEALLSAPFLTPALQERELTEEVSKRGLAYIEEFRDFLRRFHPEERFNKFSELTGGLDGVWVAEKGDIEVARFDNDYLTHVYRLARALVREEDVAFDGIYQLLGKTQMRRGRIFDTRLERDHNLRDYLHHEPAEPTRLTFDDIAGYEDQKLFYNELLRLVEDDDEALGALRMVLIVGKPGLGKSLGVQAFINNLPDNARGIIFRSVTDGLLEINLLEELASLHPELQIFAVIEDIDAHAGDRVHNRGTRKFLQIGSVGNQRESTNLHLLVTTNRPDIIDPAVTRPGRVDEVVMYDLPTPSDRMAILQYQSKQWEISLSDDLMTHLANTTEGFTPAELNYVIWSLRRRGITEPTIKDIDGQIEHLKKRQNLVQQDLTKN